MGIPMRRLSPMVACGVSRSHCRLPFISQLHCLTPIRMPQTNMLVHTLLSVSLLRRASPYSHATRSAPHGFQTSTGRRVPFVFTHNRLAEYFC
ncbi:MAG: hypothetical protein MJE68_27230 [Proteobacteria bacterium]|nr:hypothetical protein [Pseudomonadota bacterium]